MIRYTARELAERACRELGVKITWRTVYYYRQEKLLSPLAASGSQPRFSQRHFLELAAALALRRAPDQPTLAEIAAMLRDLSDAELATLAEAIGPTSQELLSIPPAGLRRSSRDGHLLVAEGGFYDPPAASLPAAAVEAQGKTIPASEKPAGAVTINLAPGVTLHLGPRASQEFVSKLLALALDHAGGGPGGETGA